MYKPHLPTEPIHPKPNKKKCTVSYEIYNTTERICHWDGWKGHHDDEMDETYNKVIDKIGMANRKQVIRLSEVIKRLPKHTKLEDLYFTASLCDDHLQLHVRYDEEADLYEEQMKKYKEDMEEWNCIKERYDKQIVVYEQELKKELLSIKKT